ncbi:peroxisome biogenesis factor 10-like [Atheta coriaria]|uniref:peroxisome biogenesis factor 10-like n=1 Tax=Dalotia coriaria TaxID=877792 RepID=UPI0031F3CB32
MSFYKAEISDILRANQRDNDFINELQEYMTDLVKLLTGSGQNYNKIRQLIPLCTNAWYYLLTSVSNLQTLGEEYTGTIRVSPDNELISQFGQLLWLCLYVGGNQMYDRALVHIGKTVHQNRELTEDAKKSFLKTCDFLKENKYILLRLHHSIFYIFGTYHSVANRLTGVKYVLLRQWMQDTTATTSFNILGYISLIYLVYLLAEKIMSASKTSYTYPTVGSGSVSSKVCVLCADNCKNVSCTPCGHLFCWECIYDSLKYQPNCPMCREEIKPSRIIPLQNY